MGNETCRPGNVSAPGRQSQEGIGHNSISTEGAAPVLAPILRVLVVTAHECITPMKTQALALAALVLLVTWGPTTVSSQAPDKSRKKAKKSDEMWVASSIPTLPTGVTHHTLRSEAMKRDVGY